MLLMKTFSMTLQIFKVVYAHQLYLTLTVILLRCEPKYSQRQNYTFFFNERPLKERQSSEQ